MRLAALIGLLLSIGCARQSRLINELSSADAMRQALLNRVPIGTSMANATSTLAAEGFTCGASSRGTFATSDSLTYSYCQARSSGAVVFRQWQVAVVDSGGVVGDIRVTTGLVGP